MKMNSVLIRRMILMEQGHLILYMNILKNDYEWCVQNGLEVLRQWRIIESKTVEYVNWNGGRS